MTRPRHTSGPKKGLFMSDADIWYWHSKCYAEYELSKNISDRYLLCLVSGVALAAIYMILQLV